MTTTTPGRGANAVDTLAGRLIRTLILWIGGVWLLGVLGVVWYVDREINHNFDNELVEVSHRMFDIAIQDVDAHAANPAGTQPLGQTPSAAQGFGTPDSRPSACCSHGEGRSAPQA